MKHKLAREQNIEELKEMGLTIGKNFNKQGYVIIDPSHAWLISIGDNVTLAARVYILAHDASTKVSLGYTKIGRVIIGNNVFVGANSIILPNVKVGNNVIVGCGSVITKNIPDNSVVAGNPAKVICKTNDYISRHMKSMGNRPVYDESWTTSGHITCQMKADMIEQLDDGIGYIK